jgi:hypothetical protein
MIYPDDTDFRRLIVAVATPIIQDHPEMVSLIHSDSEVVLNRVVALVRKQ